jgi:hypothetical protein
LTEINENTDQQQVDTNEPIDVVEDQNRNITTEDHIKEHIKVALLR